MLPRSRPSESVPHASDHIASNSPSRTERRRQVRALVVLAILALTFTILRAGVHSVFGHGWWRLW